MFMVLSVRMQAFREKSREYGLISVERASLLAAAHLRLGPTMRAAARREEHFSPSEQLAESVAELNGRPADPLSPGS